MTDPVQRDLSEADAQRMRVLLDEVNARLGEMATIFCGAVGIERSGQAQLKLIPKSTFGANPVYMEVYCDQTSCGCVVYYADGRVSVEWPCGG